MAFPVDIFGGSSAWAIGGFGIFGAVIALAWALTRSMPGLAGAVGREAREVSREERLVGWGLTTEEKEEGEEKEAALEEGGAARDAQIEAASDVQAEREEAIGAAGPAIAAEKRAAAAGKGEARLSNKVTKTRAVIKKQKRAELKDAQKKIKDISDELAETQKLGQAQRIPRVQQKLQQAQMEEQRKQRELQFINRLIQQQRQGQMSIKITTKARQNIIKQIEQGMAKQVAVVEQRAVMQERRRGFTEQQEAATLGQFLAAEEQDVAKERAELQRLEAEKARLAWEEQTAKVFDELEKEIGNELKEIRNLTKNIFKTESKNVQVRAALSMKIIRDTQQIFSDAANSINIYNQQKKTTNINAKGQELQRMEIYLRQAMVAAAAENADFNEALGRLPEGPTQKAIFRDLKLIYNKINAILSQIKQAIKKLRWLEQ